MVNNGLISFQACEVGFDLREKQFPVYLPDGNYNVRYDGPDGPLTVAGSRQEIVRALKKAGYKVSKKAGECADPE